MSETGKRLNRFLERLTSGKVLVSDGATGTYLQSHGLEPGACPEEFNASHPEVIQGMARAYFDAGSEMVLTNSFGANRFMLAKYGYGDQVAEFNRLAAEHARSQAPAGGFVIGSVGPSGEFLQPLGEVSEPEMLDAFTEQMLALEEGGADGVVIETMTALEEAGIIGYGPTNPRPVQRPSLDEQVRQGRMQRYETDYEEQVRRAFPG